MKAQEIIETLPKLYNFDSKMPEKAYTILKRLDMPTTGKYYDKIKELVVSGFLKQVEDNPPAYIPDKDKIWEFWKNTPVGVDTFNMIKDRVITF